jgi:hypothetical protein
VRNFVLAIAVLIFYALHQDLWFWHSARPLVFGFIPIGLFYHACYSVGASLMMCLLVKYAWPGHLEAEAEAASEEDDSADREPAR